MEKRATAICDLPSDQFRRHSSRTITDRCRNWTRMRQDENMPILLKTQVESADKTPVTARRARVGGLCGFRSPAERVPIQQQKTRRCANVREHCGHGKRGKRTAAGGFWQREKPQAAKQDKAAGSCASRGGHICPPCRQFRRSARELLRGKKQHSCGHDLKKARRFKENDGVARKRRIEIEQISAGE